MLFVAVDRFIHSLCHADSLRLENGLMGSLAEPVCSVYELCVCVYMCVRVRVRACVHRY